MSLECPAFSLLLHVLPLRLQAIDDGSPGKIGVGNLTVTINDVNEAPIFPPETVDVWVVAENCVNGTAVAVVTATDPDAADQGSVLLYSWVNPVTDGTGKNRVFAIDAHTGALTTSGAVDYEYQRNYTVMIVRTILLHSHWYASVVCYYEDKELFIWCSRFLHSE